MRIQPIGRHQLKLIEVTEKQSLFRSNTTVTTLVNELVANPEEKINITVTDKFTPENLADLVKCYDLETGNKLGHTIFEFDFKDLIGRIGFFTLKSESFGGINHIKASW